MSVTHDEVRQIEAEAAPTRFARGWHCLGLDRRTSATASRTRSQAFGTKLVVFAGERRRRSTCSTPTAGTWAATCRQGTVKGDEIACPFHDWRWGGDGRASRSPTPAAFRRWPAPAPGPPSSRTGCCSSGTTPRATRRPTDVTIPRIEGGDRDEWTDWDWYTTIVEGTNCREIIDNVVDMAHFFYIHCSFPTYFKNVFEGHVATQYMNGVGRAGHPSAREPGEPEAARQLRRSRRTTARRS